MAMLRPLVVGNMKMNGTRASTASLVSALVEGLPTVDVDVGVCVPFPLLEHVTRLTDGVSILVGAQDVSDCAQGAYTGEVSASMLQEAGCRLVIVGHSERRVRHRETDDAVASKVRLALAHDLTPVVCVGESMSERSDGQTQQAVQRQLDAVLSKLGPSELGRFVVAYEPVWAIGTGRSATPQQAQDVHAAIRARLAVISSEVAACTRILYGGSVKPETAGDLFEQADIDGALVGAASLAANDFLAIVRAAVRRT